MPNKKHHYLAPKRIIFFLTAILFAVNVFGQCEVFYFQEKTEFESHLKKALVAYSGGVDTLAVVVHIVSEDSLGSNSNLTAIEVLNQIHATNLDLLRLNSDAHKTPTEYRQIAASLDFVLGLATLNPSGEVMQEAGINRIHPKDFGLTSPPYSQSYLRNTVMPKTGWDRDKYINIWVCDLNSLLGFSSFPMLGLPDLPGGIRPEQDGIVIDFQNFGTSHPKLKPAYRLGRTLTHELGHYFGLYHTFEGCEDDDYCDDTPQAPKANYFCDPKLMACDGSKSMFENFLDYSNDECMNLFTQNQRNRVRIVLDNSPRRKTLKNRTMPVVTGLEAQKNILRLKSNPVYDKLEFSEPLENRQVQIFDLQGKTRLTQVVQGASLEISFLPSGIYVVRIEEFIFRFMKI